jgi:hypothetical protein
VQIDPNTMPLTDIDTMITDINPKMLVEGNEEPNEKKRKHV